jgi:hypothetical protein
MEIAGKLLECDEKVNKNSSQRNIAGSTAPWLFSKKGINTWQILFSNLVFANYDHISNIRFAENLQTQSSRRPQEKIHHRIDADSKHSGIASHLDESTIRGRNPSDTRATVSNRKCSTCEVSETILNYIYRVPGYIGFSSDKPHTRREKLHTGPHKID